MFTHHQKGTEKPQRTAQDIDWSKNFEQVVDQYTKIL